MQTDVERPIISGGEFAARYQRAQALAQAAGLDVLLVNSNEADFSNVRYFSDYWPIFEIAGRLQSQHARFLTAAACAREAGDTIIPCGK